jgi:hypothetical protein
LGLFWEVSFGTFLGSLIWDFSFGTGRTSHELGEPATNWTNRH